MKHLKEIFYLELTGFWDRMKPEDQNQMIIKGFAKNGKLILGTLKVSFFNLFEKEFFFNSYHSKTWVICEAEHNCNALNFLANGENVFVNPEDDFEFNRSFFLQVYYLFPLYFSLLRLNKLQYYSYLFYRVAYYKQCLRYLRKYQPSKIVFSADIKPRHRAFLFAAKKIGIKTYYFQHACISEGFPPLSFDYSFLDGQDAYDKYSKSGEFDGEVKLVGMQRYKMLLNNVNSNSEVNTIGIATNSLDKIEEIETLCILISERFPTIKLMLRMHPLDKRTIRIKSSSFSVSDANNVDVVDFLSQIDLLIAGDSSIHLEASIMNIVCVYYFMSRLNTFDYYGFVKNDLCIHIKNLDELDSFVSEQILKKREASKVLAYYDENQKREIDFDEILYKHELV